jgi:alpha-L-fucosidase
MKSGLTRRKFLQTTALAAASARTSLWQSGLQAQAPAAPSKGTLPAIAPGPFKGSRESLAAYHMPDWFADAKLGMWNHWGPQSAAEYGDWYARRMYVQGEAQYQHHLEHYGHPSKTGFVDVIKSWKADKFDADYLMGLYQKAGAK